MKKKKVSIISAMLAMFLLLPASNVSATDFSSDEDYWQNRCNTSQDSEADQATCNEFRQYLNNKKDSLNGQLSSITKQVEDLKTNIENASKVVKELQTQLDYYQKNIELNEANIRTIQTEITTLNENIEKKQKEIDKRNNLIKRRMVDEQGDLGTNMEVEIIMGANDLVDMIRKIDALQKITESDKAEIALIKKEKAKLALDKKEKQRLKEEQETKKAENEEHKVSIEALKKAQEEVITTYRSQEAELTEKMRSVQVDINTLRNNIISISDPGNLDFSSNNGFINPVQSGYISAGTWYYPGGGAHLGMDKATSIGTPVYAPADGIILYANNPVSSNSGYIGNWSGYPQGGGNTIQMLTQVNGTTYAISFFHLSQNGFAISAGSQVSAGQRIALTGNSGNSSGPHCHIEVINLGSMSISTAISRFQASADFSWGTGWGSGAINYACGVSGTPCRMRPESIFS